MSYCINPHCSHPEDAANSNNLICCHCGSRLLLQNRYRVVRLLSDSSGFATIHEVTANGEIIEILKVLKPEHNSCTRAVELFKQEALVLSQLQHSGVPTVEPNAYFQYFPHNDSEPLHCFVMEKINGPNLKQWMYQRGNLPIDEQHALNWLKEIAEVLHIVHQKHYFHRDIKLQNIMVRPNNQLVLIDFGAAREMTYTYLAQMGSAGKVTKISSAGYTPPEQEKGHAVPQSDFYALGRTFVYLLTGKELTDAAIYNPLTDEFNWREYALGISEEFADFIDCLMAPKAINRPRDTQEILDILAEFLGNSGVSNPTTKIQGARDRPPEKQAKSKLKSSWLLSGIVILSLAASSYALWYNRHYFGGQQAMPSQIDGHLSYVNSVAISPDGKVLASGSADRTVRLWNLATGEELRALSGHLSYVNAVVISPDGKVLASGSADQTIKLWDISSGEELQTLSGHEGPVEAVVFSPDGITLASTGADRTIRLWDLGTGEELQALRGHTSYINALAMSPDGSTVASGSADKTIKLWDLSTGEEVQTLRGHTSYINALVISHDGSTLVSGSADKTIKLWDLSTGKEVRTLRGHTSYINALVISHDGSTLASGSADRTVKFWDLDTGEMVRTLSGYPHPVDYFDMSPDWSVIAVGSSKDSTIQIQQIDP